MKSLVVTAGMVVALAAPAAATADPAVHSTVVTRGENEQILEGQTCFTEATLLRSRDQMVTTVTQTSAGSFSFVENFTVTYEMVGLVTGLRYRGVEHLTQGGHADVSDGTPSVGFIVFTIMETSQTVLPNLLLQWRFVFVMNANGEVAVVRDDFSVRCVGGGEPPVEQE